MACTLAVSTSKSTGLAIKSSPPMFMAITIFMLSEAEERKIRILKEYGYNAIRSAHNPCSKALLDACDRLGMLVMDEYVDMWYIHKNRYDYADYITDWYARDIKDMIEKDYNHPSVIMYSLGNEVAETGEKRGIEFFLAIISRASSDMGLRGRRSSSYLKALRRSLLKRSSSRLPYTTFSVWRRGRGDAASRLGLKSLPASPLRKVL